MYRAASYSCSRGSAPSAAPGRLEDGAPAMHEHLRRDGVPTPRMGMHWAALPLTLAGECPLFSAWGRFEDGAPAPRECLRPK